MRVLFAITVCCFCAVLWVALALARRIRRGQMIAAKAKPVRNPATREFFEAGEFRTPRPLHLDQEIFKQKPRRPLADINFAFERLAPLSNKPVSNQAVPGIERLRSPQPVPLRPPAPAYTTLFGQNISISQLETQIETRNETRIDAAHSAVPLVPVKERNVANALQASAPLDVTRRIPPQPERGSGLRRRVDLSQFNKDMGDLTDPYTNPLRGSGTLGPAAIDNRYRSER